MSDEASRYFIKPGYTSRPRPEYFEDSLAGTGGLVHQPDVYPFARYLAGRYGCGHVIDIGCGRALKLAELHPGLHVIGIDYGPNIAWCRAHHPFGRFIDWDLESRDRMPIEPEIARDSIVVCSDVIEHLADPLPLLANLRALMDHAPAGLLSTPERDLVRGAASPGPPENPAHVREWNLAELASLLDAAGLNGSLIGLTLNNDRDRRKRTTLAVLENNATPPLAAAPRAFRVAAIMTAYNEEDVIVPSITRLLGQGIQVHLIDNWSTDATYDLAGKLGESGLIGLERFPAAGPVAHYNWRDLLHRVEAVSAKIRADWFIHHDADEAREPPWPGVSLRDGLHHVDRCGFNAVDHACLIFHPTGDGFLRGSDFVDHFRHFELGRRPGHLVQVKAWKNTGGPVDLAGSGGHEVRFEGRRVYPFRFLLRHYPIRSQAHGVRKILVERKARWNPEERAMGWHTHYDAIREGHSFLKDPSGLLEFDEETFRRDYLVERLSATGLLMKEKEG